MKIHSYFIYYIIVIKLYKQKYKQIKQTNKQTKNKNKTKQNKKTISIFLLIFPFFLKWHYPPKSQIFVTHKNYQM
jgi:Ca2+/Na+ antiporter